MTLRKDYLTSPIHRFIDHFFWDTDGLALEVLYEPLDPWAKPSWGANTETSGVMQGLAPRPDELNLEVCGERDETAE
jgi:hypothetical protein